MKNNLKNIVLFGLLLAVASCSIEKRHYTSGYHIDWKNKAGSVTQYPAGIETKALPSQPPVQDELAAQPSPEGINSVTGEHLTNNVIPQSGPVIGNLASSGDNPVIDMEVVAGKPDPAQNPIASSPVTSPAPSSPPLPSSEPRTQGMATASLVLGILSLISFYGSFLFGLLAIIFGGSALKRIKKNPEKFKGKGLATAGLICGIVGVALILLIIAVAV